jgi:hypothetical protein
MSKKRHYFKIRIDKKINFLNFTLNVTTTEHCLGVRTKYSHHAEGLVDPKVLAKKLKI